MKSFIIFSIIFLSTLLFGGRIELPTNIVNGVNTNFSSNANENYFSLQTMAPGNILIVGDAVNSGKFIYSVYDSNWNTISTSASGTQLISVSLGTGDYFIHIQGFNYSESGTFKVYSPVMHEFDNLAGIKKIVNGENTIFYDDYLKNLYHLTLNNNGNILLSGNGSLSGKFSYTIYDKQLVYVTNGYNINSELIDLTAGEYLIHIRGYWSSEGGSFNIYSPSMSGDIVTKPFYNGVATDFSANQAENFYHFTINSDTNLLVSGDGDTSGKINYTIYSNSLQLIKNEDGISSTSVALKAGDYIIQIRGATSNEGGKFLLYSTGITGFYNFARLNSFVNGKTRIFSDLYTNNFYKFTMNEKGKMLLNATGNSSNKANYVIYDSTLAKVKSNYNINFDTIDLDAGQYVLHIKGYYSSEVGTFNLFSPYMDGYDSLLDKHISNGVQTPFSADYSENYFSFRMNTAGRLIVAGDGDVSGRLNFMIYDANLTEAIDPVERISAQSVKLDAGDYLIQVKGYSPISNETGNFFIYSEHIDNFDNFRRFKGLANGKVTATSENYLDEFFRFGMRSDGIVSLVGAGALGGGDRSGFLTYRIYDSDMQRVSADYKISSKTANLTQGSYILHVRGYWGNETAQFILSSSVMSPRTLFTYSPQQLALAYEPIQFYADAYSTNSNISHYLWNFGDGATSNSKSPIHVYDEDGIYSVKCTVYDGAGNSTIETLDIAVGVDYHAKIYKTSTKPTTSNSSALHPAIIYMLLR